jgi:hypothetical protein
VAQDGRADAERATAGRIARHGVEGLQLRVNAFNLRRHQGKYRISGHRPAAEHSAASGGAKALSENPAEFMPVFIFRKTLRQLRQVRGQPVRMLIAVDGVQRGASTAQVTRVWQPSSSKMGPVIRTR